MKYTVAISIRIFLIALFAVCRSEVNGSSPLVQPPVPVVGSRPNVLFLLSDDQQRNAIGAMGNGVIQTPNLDRLVRAGVSFTRAHAELPSCVPSRASLLTGASGFTHRSMHPGYSRTPVNPDLALWPATMKKAGYTTFFTGKWNTHGPPARHGFERVERCFTGGMRAHQMRFEENDRVYEGFSSELFADAAIEFLRSPPPSPFFMMVSFTAPHDPRTPPDAYRSGYDPATIPLPPNYLPRHPFDNGLITARDEKLLPWPRTEAAVQREIALYYGMISHMDAQIGRIMGALEASGQADNTLVLFASDNGLAVGQHGLLGKQSQYDHSLLVPLVIVGPGIPRNERRDALCYLYDLFPTVCELTRIPVPSTVEGLSLVPVLNGRKKQVRDTLFCGQGDVQRMVRDERFKLIRYYQAPDRQRDSLPGALKGTNRIQLFNTDSDPWETRDLAADPQYAITVERLESALARWQKRVGDFLGP